MACKTDDAARLIAQKILSEISDYIGNTNNAAIGESGCHHYFVPMPKDPNGHTISTGNGKYWMNRNEHSDAVRMVLDQLQKTLKYVNFKYHLEVPPLLPQSFSLLKILKKCKCAGDPLPENPHPCPETLFYAKGCDMSEIGIANIIYICVSRDFISQPTREFFVPL